MGDETPKRSAVHASTDVAPSSRNVCAPPDLAQADQDPAHRAAAIWRKSSSRPAASSSLDSAATALIRSAPVVVKSEAFSDIENRTVGFVHGDAPENGFQVGGVVSSAAAMAAPVGLEFR